MESSEELGHKPSIKSLVINPAMSSSSDDVEVVFSDDYIDSPQSSDIKSPLDMSGDGSGDGQSDELSSLGTVEADEDVNDRSREKAEPDLTLPIVPPSSVIEPGTLLNYNNNNSECKCHLSLPFVFCFDGCFLSNVG